MRTHAIAFAALALAAACGGDPVSLSKPVALNLKAKSGDVSGTTIKADKAISTESGNPYAAFINEAKTKLGKDPKRIEVTRIEVLLATSSTNVTALNEVFNGTVDIQFVMNDTNNIYAVAHTTIDSGTSGRGPITFSIDFDDDKAAASADWAKFLTGSFKAVIGGVAASGFAGKSATADFQLSFTFAAYEE